MRNSPPARPIDLTPESLSDVLCSYCYGEDGSPPPRRPIAIESLAIRPIDEGVLSEVVDVSVTYAEEGDEEERRQLPRGFVAKFLRPSMPQRHMFRVEGSFYALVERQRRDVRRNREGRPGESEEQERRGLEDRDSRSVSSLPSLPFRIPRAVHVSDGFILLERIDRVKRHSLLDGCPPDAQEAMVKSLATLHARCWNAVDPVVFDQLSPTAGIGTALPGLVKERSFPGCWEAFVNGVGGISDEERARTRDLCRMLSNKRLREVHDRVHGWKPTLVHGDYHVANALFPLEPDDRGDVENRMGDAASSSFWLLDWATCGRGNPINDFTFFLLVSTSATDDPEDVADAERLLRLYHSALIDPDLCSEGSAIRDDPPTYDACLRSYRDCVLNQFLVLVCYDRVSRQLIETTEVQQLRTERLAHFNNVNRRCVRALLSPLVDVGSMDAAAEKTEEDLVAEREWDVAGGISDLEI